MRASEMKHFWDHRAAEDPFYFVDNRLRYGRPDQGLFWSRGEQELGALLRSLGVQIEPSDNVVEVGCGIGRLTRALARSARTVRAVDVSPRMIELARAYGPELSNVEWIVGDGTTLSPIGDASADACISHVVFQHIPDPQVTLGYVVEMGRVLRPGGWAAFQVSNDQAVHRRRDAGQRLRLALRGTFRRGPRGQSHRAWLGSAVELDDVRRAAQQGRMDLERVVGEGTQMCLVLTRHRG